MTTICKYCNEPENKQYRPGLICDTCICFIHLTCLRRLGTPGDLACDVFFDFTCEDCSPTNKEVFTRSRFPWVNVILLTLHHLTTNAYGISNHGFFHYKTHICSFIDRNWNILFDPQFKQKKNWVGTIAGALSVYSNLMFRSGSTALGETGWWKLQHAFSPAVASHIIQEMARDKPKGRPRSQMAVDIGLFVEKVTEMGYKEFLRMEEEELNIERGPSKKRRLEFDYNTSNTTYYDQADSDTRQDAQEEETPSAQEFQDGGAFRGFLYQAASYVPQSDSSSMHSLHQSALYYDSDSRSASPHYQPEPEAPEPEDDKKPEQRPRKPEEKQELTRESLFSKHMNSVDLPWVEKYEVKKDLVALTQYEEVQLLKQVESLIQKVKEPNKKAYLHRLRAKLSLRRLKRHKHLPCFDLDKAVKVVSGQVPEDSQAPAGTERVLDRFQRSYLQDNLCGTIPDYGGVSLLASVEPTPFRSAFSHALLKPYIRRHHVSPLWPRLTDELLIRTNRHIKDYKPPAHATLDYSYVRPHHIAAVNNLCAQFFWPGIDLTEALQYPEFSCVATYKRLVVGCAFLVPGASAAYISFVLVRPEWRRAGVATFMLYHLLQTCSGKDVTLHVSPTNPAIFLYQKFGFKVEELVQDFYEKYYDIDYKGCRHALFLRLTR